MLRVPMGLQNFNCSVHYPTPKPGVLVYTVDHSRPNKMSPKALAGYTWERTVGVCACWRCDQIKYSQRDLATVYFMKTLICF